MLVLPRGELRVSHCSRESDTSGTTKGRHTGRGHRRSRRPLPPQQQLQLAEVQWRQRQLRA